MFSSFLVHRPEVKSQQRSDLSSATEIKNRPWGWKHRSVTQLSWPTSVMTHLPFLTSQILMVLSLLPLAKYSRTARVGASLATPPLTTPLCSSSSSAAADSLLFSTVAPSTSYPPRFAAAFFIFKFSFICWIRSFVVRRCVAVARDSSPMVAPSDGASGVAAGVAYVAFAT